MYATTIKCYIFVDVAGDEALEAAIAAFQQRWSQSRTRMLDALEGSTDLEKKNHVRRGIEKLDSILEQLIKLLKFLQGNVDTFPLER